MVGETADVDVILVDAAEVSNHLLGGEVEQSHTERVAGHQHVIVRRVDMHRRELFERLELAHDLTGLVPSC